MVQTGNCLFFPDAQKPDAQKKATAAAPVRYQQ